MSPYPLHQCLCGEEGNLWGLSVKNHGGSGTGVGWDTSSQPLDLRIPLHHLQMFIRDLPRPCIPLPRTGCVPPRLSVLASVEAAGFSVGRRGLCSSPFSAPFSLPAHPPKPPGPDIYAVQEKKGQTL